jgi:hypothetical protein
MEDHCALVLDTAANVLGLANVCRKFTPAESTAPADSTAPVRGSYDKLVSLALWDAVMVGLSELLEEGGKGAQAARRTRAELVRNGDAVRRAYQLLFLEEQWQRALRRTSRGLLEERITLFKECVRGALQVRCAAAVQRA